MRRIVPAVLLFAIASVASAEPLPARKSTGQTSAYCLAHPNNCVGTADINGLLDQVTGWVNVTSHGAKCDGSNDAAALAAANTAALAGPYGLFIPCKLTLTSGAGTISAGVLFLPGGSIDVQAGGSVTISGAVTADLHRIFYLSGGTVAFSSRVPEVYPEWWGAKTDGSDGAAGLQAAIDSGAKKVRLSSGRYLYKTGLVTAAECGQTLTGNGPGATVLSFEPDSYYGTGNDTALWFGNHTENTPVTIYQCSKPTLRDLSIEVNEHARVGLRMREVIGAYVDHIFIGGKAGAVTSNLTTLLIDGAINSTFNRFELNPNNGLEGANTLGLSAGGSVNLARTAGSGSGAAITSSKFRDCYIHYANFGAKLSNFNGNSFDNCIFEALYGGGIEISDPFVGEFNNGYYEAISGPAFKLDWTDTRNRSQVIIRGGWYQAGAKSGYENDAFIYARWVNRLRVEGVQANGTKSIGKLIDAANCNSLEIESNPWSFKTGRPAPDDTRYEPSEVSLTNPFSVTLDSNLVTVLWANHGLGVGATIGFKGFTTPLPGTTYPINRPFYRVTSVLDMNRFVAVPLLASDQKADATVNNAGGTGTLLVYGGGVWSMPVLDQPDITKVLDAEPAEVVFHKSWNVAGDNQPMTVPTTAAPPIACSVSLATAGIAAGTTAAQSIACPGAVIGSACSVASPATLEAGLLQACFVSAANTITVRTANVSAGFVTPAGGQSLIVRTQENPSAEDGMYLDTWTYLMTARRSRSVTYPTTFTNYAHVYADLPTGFEQNLLVAELREIAANEYQGDLMNLGVKLPPGTRLRARTFSTTTGAGEARTEAVTLRLAKTPYRTVTE